MKDLIKVLMVIFGSFFSILSLIAVNLAPVVFIVLLAIKLAGFSDMPVFDWSLFELSIIMTPIYMLILGIISFIGNVIIAVIGNEL